MAELKTGTLDRDASRKVALVTGASRGIGRSTALRLATDGYDVAVIYVGSAEPFEEVVEELRSAGACAKAYECDVSSSKEVDACVGQVLDDFGHVWTLVNNAGITRDGIMARMKDGDFDSVIAVNLKGAFNMVRALTRTFMRQRGGRIINMSSVVGIMGNAGQVNYSASKAGLIGLTKSVARELASRNVTCNAIAPGFVETAMTAGLSDATRKSYEGQIPLGRMCVPEDIAAAISFLASDEASLITGVVLPVDGGMAM